MPRSALRAIFLTSESPYPSTGGGKLRDAAALKLLHERAEDVEILCFASAATPLGGDAGARPPGVRLTSIDRDRAPLWKRLAYPFRPYVVNGYSRRMEQELRARAAPGKLLWISRLAMAQYIPLARELGYRIILDEHNIESAVLMAGARSSMRNWPQSFLAAQCAWYEERFCESSDFVVTSSDIDASRLHKLAPDAAVHVIPNSVDCPQYQAARGGPGSTLFFPGTLNYAPNVDGLLWFAAEVLPRLRACMKEELPRIVVAGSNPTPAIRSRLESVGIEVHANPKSILPYLAEAAVVFVPIQSGGGTRLKILEAMAAGRAVVSTGKGAEGLVLTPTYDVFIADQADAFTSAIVRLLRDRQLREDVGAHAVRTIEERYDWRCARPLIESLLASLAGERPVAVEKA